MSNLIKIVLMSSLVCFGNLATAADPINPGLSICKEIEHDPNSFQFCNNEDLKKFILVPNKIDNDISAMYQYTGSSKINSVATAFRKLIALQSSVRGYETVWSNVYQADVDYLNGFLSQDYTYSSAFTPKQQKEIMSLYTSNSKNTLIMFFDFKYFAAGTTQFSRYSLIYNYATKKGLFLGRKLYIND